MGNLWHTEALGRIISGFAGEIDYAVDTIIIMAFEDITGYEVDDEFVAGSGEILSRAGVTEVTSTGYAGGFEGADRLSLASKTITVQAGTNQVELDCADLTWPSIDQAGSETWVAFLIAKELTSDALSPAMFFVDTGTGIPLTPNGSDITYAVAATGIATIGSA